MSNSEQSRIEQADEEPLGSCGARDLKTMLATIAAQLVDADKRHSASFEDLQDRIATLGRDARSIRDRVPPQYVSAFERIEAGVRDLADRLAETLPDTAPPPPADPDPEGTPPKGSGSKSKSDREGSRPRAEEVQVAQRAAADLDVARASVAGDVTEPWDEDSAEALSSVYEPPKRPAVSKPKPEEKPASLHASVDQAWLEARFGEIAKGIEQSLAEIRPDRGFFALGQRFDQFEQQFTTLLNNVATQADFEGIRLIESQVGEVVDQLVQTQDQLTRLGAIEEQLATISTALADVHQAATASMDPNLAPSAGGASSPVDADAIARAAAEEAAIKILSLLEPGKQAADAELRPLIEQLMSESRQGEENTAALLDTMQQAMIRLLDRVDAIELAQQQALTAPAAREAKQEKLPSSSEPPKAASAPPAEKRVPPTASKELVPSRGIREAEEEAPQAERLPRTSDKSRQDFIAEARRAKMRLATGQATNDDEIVIGASTSDSASGSTFSPGPRQKMAPESTDKSTGPSAPSPRIIVMAVAAVLALGGLWYSLDANTPLPAKSVAASAAAPKAAAAPAKPAANASAKPATPSGAAPAQLKTINGAASPDGVGPHSDASLGLKTEGAIVSNDPPAAKTTLPLLGVAVDMDRPVTADDLKQAQRHQAMATISGELAEVAAKRSKDIATPAVLIPKESELSAIAGALDAGKKGGGSGPLDMPPASVGPLSLRLAAANGDRSAQFEVGSRLAEGKGTQQNFKDAAKWYQRAADQGSAQAEYRLGTLYERGLGLKANAGQAAIWYKRAAEQGNIKAMHNLAVLSANQSDQSPDYVTASQWFMKAAERGLSDSQFNLAILYENGLGVEADMKEAYKWLALAAKSGDKEAIKRRDIIRGKLTADEIKAAENMVATWRPTPVDKDVNDSRLAGEAWKKNPKNGISG